MTERRPPLTDEDLTAAIDGNAPPDVTDRIATDEAATARLSALRAAAEVAATPVEPLSDAAIDDLVANVLAASDDTEPEAHRPGQRRDDPAGASTSDDDVVAPPPPTGPRRAVPTWLVAAAVAVVVAVGLVLVWSGTRNGNTSTNTAARTASSAVDANSSKSDATGTTAFGAGHGADSENGARAEAPATSAETRNDGVGGSIAPDGASAVVNLGTFPDADALRTALASGFPSAGAARSGADAGSVPSTASIERCRTQVRTTLNGTREPPPLPATPPQQGFALVAGSKVLVYEFATTTFESGHSALVAAVGIDACNPILTFVR